MPCLICLGEGTQNSRGEETALNSETTGICSNEMAACLCKWHRSMKGLAFTLPLPFQNALLLSFPRMSACSDNIASPT